MNRVIDHEVKGQFKAPAHHERLVEPDGTGEVGRQLVEVVCGRELCSHRWRWSMSERAIEAVPTARSVPGPRQSSLDIIRAAPKYGQLPGQSFRQAWGCHRRTSSCYCMAVGIRGPHAESRAWLQRVRAPTPHRVHCTHTSTAQQRKVSTT